MGLEDFKLNFFETKYTTETSTGSGGGTNTDDYAKKLISIFDANRSGTLEETEKQTAKATIISEGIENFAKKYSISIDSVKQFFGISKNSNNAVLQELADGSKVFNFNGQELVIQANGLMTADSSIGVKELSKLISAYKSYVAQKTPEEATVTNFSSTATNQSSFNKPDWFASNKDFPAKYKPENLEKVYPPDKYFIMNDGAELKVINKINSKVVFEMSAFSSEVMIYDDNGVKTKSEVYEKGQLSIENYYDEKTGMIKQTTEYTRDKSGKLESYRIDMFDPKTEEHIYTRYIECKNGKITDNYTDEYNPLWVAKKLQEDIYAKNSLGLPTTGSHIADHVKMISSENIYSVMTLYKQNNPDGEDLITAIANETGLSVKERMEMIKHIVDIIVEEGRKATNSNQAWAELASEINQFMQKESDSLVKIDAKHLTDLLGRMERLRYGAQKAQYADKSEEANGMIDGHFEQGNVGSCWVLASIVAITNNPKGRQIINNSLQKNTDGSITVTLKGVNKSYRISKEELLGYDWSSGDLDVRAIEIAISLYMKENPDKFNGDDDIDGGYERWALELLTGAKGHRDFVFNWTDDKIKEFNNPNRISTVSAHSGDKKLTTANGEEITLYEAHAYAVVGSDDNCVYLVNPHDSSKILAIPIDTFKEFFECVEYCDL